MATTVKTAAPTRLARHLGAGTPWGQARRTKDAVRALRTASITTVAQAKDIHERVKTSSQRRSWKTPNGAGALTWGATAMEDLRPKAQSSTASVTTPAIEAATRRQWERSRGGSQLMAWPPP